MKTTSRTLDWCCLGGAGVDIDAMQLKNEMQQCRVVEWYVCSRAV